MSAPETKRILVMDKDTCCSNELADQLGALGYSALTASTCSEARKVLDKEKYSVVIASPDLPDWGPDWVSNLGQSPGNPTILVTCDQDSPESAFTCIRAGAYDYFPRKCDASRLEVVLERAITKRFMMERTRLFRKTVLGFAISIPLWMGVGMGIAHLLT